MTKLLVSVRDAREALAALRGGADVIDIKEPSRGSLGCSQPATWQAVTATVDGRVLTSLALGELRESPDVSAVPAGTGFVKVGLAGCRTCPTWQSDWVRLMRSLPCPALPVAVWYADEQLAEGPSVDDVLALARQGALGLLIDTFDKSAGHLFEHVTSSRLETILARAAQSGLPVALAGSLSASTLPSALRLNPHWVAVRSAACDGDRLSEVSANRVAALRALI